MIIDHIWSPVSSSKLPSTKRILTNWSEPWWKVTEMIRGLEHMAILRDLCSFTLKMRLRREFYCSLSYLAGGCREEETDSLGGHRLKMGEIGKFHPGKF